MKKTIKFILGVSAAIAAIAGVMYFLKNVLMKDYLDDFDDDDFDNDLYEEDSDDRGYVKINVPDKEDDTSEDTEEDDLSAFDNEEE